MSEIEQLLDKTSEIVLEKINQLGYECLTYKMLSLSLLDHMKKKFHLSEQEGNDLFDSFLLTIKNSLESADVEDLINHRDKGIKLGRKFKLNKKQQKLLYDLMNSDKTVDEICTLMNISRTTYYRYKNALAN